VLAVLHDLNLAAAFADRVALLAAGRVVAVGPARAVFETARLGAVYGAPIEVEEGPRGGLRILPVFEDAATGNS
jgi:iron complex transport system ATP-binding protein